MPSPLATTLTGWVDGWSISRGSGRPEAIPEGFFLRVDSPAEAARYVLADGTAHTIRAVAARVTEPRTWLKIPAEAAPVADWLGADWKLGQPLFLMSTSLVGSRTPAVPSGYRLEVDATGQTTQVTVHTTDGELAARGRIGAGASSVVFDRVVTMADHQRRGLGSIVMRSLAADALQRGFSHGILMASEDGRALYEALGWRLEQQFSEANYLPGEN